MKSSYKGTHRIIHGDSRCMGEVEDRSVHLVVTSPPYWQLKDYGSFREIGFQHSYEEYINHLNLVWQEAFRVLDDGCRLCINIGDQYARSTYYGRYKIIPIRTEIIKFCETIGFDYMGAIIWQKVCTTNTSGGASIMGSFPYPRNGIVKLDYEFILLFKKPGTPETTVSKERKEKSRLTKEEWNLYFSGHWNFVGEKQKKHLAMFPKELPWRLIKMFTFVGDTVLDPFLGSGTTSLAAKELNRDSIGYEVNADFLPLIREKLGFEENRSFKTTNFSIIQQKELRIDYEKKIETLPYRFKDPIKLEIKIDPRDKNYGSKVHKESKKRETYYTIKAIDSPEVLRLSDGRSIRLLGVCQDNELKEKAIEFLQQKLKGQRVFLRLDPGFPGGDEPTPSYLYLKNKTFINAHLLKAGLAVVDESIDFKHKKRFLLYRGQGVQEQR